MLSNILGILIAFISIILLLSVVVTALVQASQAVLRLRGRNLMKGLAAIITETADSYNEEKPTTEEKKKARKLATKILNAPNVALINRVAEPDSKSNYWLKGPAVSWLDPKELPRAIETDSKELINDSEEITRRFEQSKPHLEKRFLRTIRLWNLGWAIVVAVAFQVSTPELLNELARDAHRREMIVANVDQTMVAAGEAITQLDYELAAVEALQILQRKYPDLREVIEGANGIGTNRQSLVGELRMVLEDSAAKASPSSPTVGGSSSPPSNEDILTEYSDLLQRLGQEQLDITLLRAGDMVERLDTFGIGLWTKGDAYYFDRDRLNFNAILGVLITTILLSFGAPFWYQQLRNVINLRDILSPKPKSEPQQEVVNNVTPPPSSESQADDRG